MSTVTLIGLDLGKHSFHLHGQDATGRMLFRKKCSRQQLFMLLGKYAVQHGGDGGLRGSALDGFHPAIRPVPGARARLVIA